MAGRGRGIKAALLLAVLVVTGSAVVAATSEPPYRADDFETLHIVDAAAVDELAEAMGAQGGAGTATTVPDAPPPSTTLPGTDVTTTTAEPAPAYDAVVQPGDSIQAVVDRLPEGASILIASGRHVGQQVEPKSGMTFTGEPGAIMDGAASTEFAFYSGEPAEAHDVTIRGLEITQYAPPVQEGAIQSVGEGWLVEDCEIHHNATAGIFLAGASVLRGCHVHHNGQIGVKVVGGEDTLVADNEISFNNFEDAYDPGWEAGGTKFVKTTGLVVRGNYVHDNHGSGLWTDIDNIDTLYEHNIVEGNWRSGINHEVSYDAVIRNNTVTGNGHRGRTSWLWEAGIMVRGPNVEVYGNVLVDNHNGIALIEQTRGSGAAEGLKFGPYTVRDAYVHDNVIINSGKSGAVSDNGNVAVFETSVFEANTYKYDDINGEWWEWRGDALRWDGWLRTGHDEDGALAKA